MAWWVMKYADNGRSFMVGYSFLSENRADRYIETKTNGNAKAFETRSKDKKVAAQEIRQQMSESGNNSSWGKNFKHKEKIGGIVQDERFEESDERLSRG